MSEHYDVIIIGTGAGGDHLLERLGAQDTAVKGMNGTLKQPILPEMAAIARRP